MATVLPMTTDPRFLQAQPSAEMAADGPAMAPHPLQTQLRDCVAEAADDLIRDFLEALDPALQALLAEARHASETRALLALGHALASNRPALQRAFVAAMRSAFDPLRQPVIKSIFDLDRLSLLSSEEMEEHIALGQLAEMAEQRGAEAGRQVQARLQWAARSFALPQLNAALAPRALPDAFALAFRQVGLTPPERVLSYRLVESQAIKAWPAVLQAALRLLDAMGVNMPRPLETEPATDLAAMISPATMQVLREARSNQSAPADSALATALLKAIEPPLACNNTTLLTALAAHWLDSLLDDPQLPASFAAELESLRLPVIKAALCDSSFFIQAVHPVRKAVEDLAENAAFTALQGFSLRPVREALHDVAERINIHGQFALDALSMPTPLPDHLLSEFRLQIGKEQTARREKLLSRVRALTEREIEARTLDVSLPAAARAALSRGFMPLLSSLTLGHGAAAPETRQARQLLERFVDSFALCVPSDARLSVLLELCTTLTGMGLPAAYVDTVRTGLQSSYAELDREAQASRSTFEGRSLGERGHLLFTATPHKAAASPVAWTQPNAGMSEGEGLDASNPALQLLEPGQWFRVRDSQRGDDRWLLLVGVHLAQDHVSFSGFDGSTTLVMRASQLLLDLGSGLAEPLSPNARAIEALQQLRAEAAGRDKRLKGFG